MFDIGFAELLLVALVALLVLGPERLPTAARTVGYWGGRARRYMRQMTTELEREVQQSEIREELEKTRDTLSQAVDMDADTGSKSVTADSSAETASAAGTETNADAVQMGNDGEDSQLSDREAETLSAWERAQIDAERMEAELNAELEADAAYAAERAEAAKAKEPPAHD